MRSMVYIGRFFIMVSRSIILIGTILLISCSGNQTTLEDIQEYSGPILEIDSGMTIYSDSAITKLIMYSAKQLEFETGDREFPDGIFIEFFEEGEIAATLKANSGYYKIEEEKYTALGDVVVRNFKEGNTLSTEELNWTPGDGKIFTDKFVRIESVDEILTGEGLTANQDLTSYEILNPEGIFSIPEESSSDSLQRYPSPTPTKNELN